MPDRRSPLVLLLSSRSTLTGLGPRLTRHGVQLQRIEAVLPSAVPRARIARSLDRFGPFDTVAISSKEAVRAFARPVLRRADRLARTVEFWAVGPETGRALRATGATHIRRASGIGAGLLRDALSGRHRRIVVPRSDRAGPTLARALVLQGHDVLDLVVYRVRPGPRLPAGAQRAARSARVVIATSPSAISHLRRMVDRSTFDHLARSARWVVLGPRTARSARGHGLRRVEVAPSPSVQRFTPYLLGVLAHAKD